MKSSFLVIHLMMFWAFGFFVSGNLECSEKLYQKKTSNQKVEDSSLLELLSNVFSDERIEQFKAKNIPDSFLEEFKKDLKFSIHMLEANSPMTKEALCQELYNFLKDLENILEPGSTKAPRPDAPSVTANDAVVGKNSCDLTQVLALLAKIKKNIDMLKELICQKFAFTWTILEDILDELTSLSSGSCDFSGVFTVLEDILESLTVNCCCPIQLTQADVIAGEILLNVDGKNYCLAENVIGDITISGQNVSLDLNDRVVVGTINVASNDVIVRNGKIFPPAPTAFAQASIAAVTIQVGARNARFLNLLIINEDSIGQDGNDGLKGRNGIDNFGDKTWIIGNCIRSGSGSDGLNGQGGNGGNGGVGILIAGNNPLIKKSVIQTGNGGNGGNGFNSNGGNGGNGGVGIEVIFDNDQIAECIIETGVGGDGGRSNVAGGNGGNGGIGVRSAGQFVCVLDTKITTSHGGNGGDGIPVGINNGGSAGNGGHGILINSTARHNKIERCNILTTGNGGIAGNGNGNNAQGGNGGNGGHGIFVEEGCGTEVRNCVVMVTGIGTDGANGGVFGFGGNGGSGGDGARINALSKDTEIRNCTFSNTGTGGIGGAAIMPGIVGTAGRAVTDLNNDTCSRFDCNDQGMSVICSNFAYAIANLEQRYIINGNLGVEGGTGSSVASNSLENVFVDCDSQYCNPCMEIFNTKTVLCDKFVGTWTILENILDEIENLNITITIENLTVTAVINVDFNSIFTVLEEIEEDIFNTKTVLCDKFVGTWTILADIEKDISGIFTAIDGISVTAIVNIDLTGVFTVLNNIDMDIFDCCTLLQAEIINTRTVLSDNFVSTWTILADIEKDISGIFTAIDGISVTAIVNIDLTGVFTVLNNIDTDIFDCCTLLQAEIINTRTVSSDNFVSTWTILADLQNAGCSSTPITQADVDAGGGTYIITQSGNYHLAQDITSVFAGGPTTAIIQISASNVSLSLCGRSINGDITSLTNGIIVDPNLTNIRIENGSILMVGLSGIFIQSGACDIWLDNLTTSSTLFGIMLNNPFISNPDVVANVFINRCQATNCSSINTKSAKDFLDIDFFEDSDIKRFQHSRFVLLPSAGLIMNACRSVTVRNSNFSENVSGDLGGFSSIDISGVRMSSCSNCYFGCCTMNNNWGSQSGFGLIMILSNNNTFEHCAFNGNRSIDTISFVGGGFGVYLLNANFNNIFRDCEASNNSGFLEGVGFRSLQGGNNSFINCVASENNGSGGGFVFESERCSSCKDCQSLCNTATVNAGDSSAGFKASSGSNNLFEHCFVLGTTADGEAAGLILAGETASSIINCICQNSTSFAGTGYGILLDLGNSVTCISCFVKNNSVMNSVGAVASYGYRDEGSPNSSSLFTGNFAFNNGTNYSVTYPSGPLPVVSGSLSGGLPATGTSGTFDNISIDA